MVESRVLKYEIEVDSKTGKITKVSDAFGKLDKKATKAAQAAAKAAASANKGFGKLADTIGKIGIAAFFGSIVIGALRTTKAFENFQRTAENSIARIVQVFEPFLSTVLNGLSGLVVAVENVITFLVKGGASVLNFLKNLRGGVSSAVKQFKKETEGLGDALVVGLIQSGSVAEGVLQETLNGQVEIIRKNAEIQIRDLTKTNAEKLKVLTDAENEINKLVKTSAEFQTKTATEREKARLEFISALRSQGEAFERKIIANQLAARKTAIESEVADLNFLRDQRIAGFDQQLADENASLVERQELLKQRMQEQIETEREVFELRRGELEERAAEDLENRIAILAQIEAIESQHQNNLTGIVSAGLRSQAALQLNAAKATKAVEVGKAQAILGVAGAMASTLVSFARRAAEDQKLTARDLAAEVVRSAGEAASGQILAGYAAGAAKEVAKFGLAGLPAAALLLGKGAVLAAAVGAATGASAKAISGGGGGGAAAPEPTFEAPTGGGGGGGIGVGVGGDAGGAAPGGLPGEGRGSVVQVNIVGTDIIQTDAAARAVEEFIERNQSL